MELLEHPNLQAALENQPLFTHQVKDLLRELLHGLAYLHSMHISHRNVKPASIILVSRMPMNIKLTGFGLATERSVNLMTRCGSAFYTAPEVYDSTCSNKVDIWSVGVIALELFTCLPEYPKFNALWPRVLQDGLEAATLDSSCYLLINSMLQFHASRRPSAQQSLGDPFFFSYPDSPETVSSPTQYAPTPPEHQAQSLSSLSGTKSTVARLLHRSGAPSPSEHAFKT